MNLAVTGASGFVGTAIKQRFKNIVPIERDDDDDTLDAKLAGCDAVINLAGAPIIARWSDPYKQILLKSRVDTTMRIVSAVDRSNVPYLISTSAVGIYPDGEPCDESCETPSEDFLGNLAKFWEDEALLCNKPTAVLRFGVVLGKEGGALKQMLTPFRLGVGGTVGDGSMITSWIDIDDLIDIYAFLLEKKLTGVFNATSPNPVSNKTLTKALGRQIHRPTLLPIPQFALNLMYGEGASVLTASKEVYPKALQDAGFHFTYPTIESSLQHQLG